MKMSGVISQEGRAGFPCSALLPAGATKRSWTSRRGVPAFKANPRRGSALIVVLWAVMLLAFAVAMSGERVALILGDASIRAKRLQAGLLADSAIASRDAILREERRRILQSTSTSDPNRKPIDFSHMVGHWQSQPIPLGEGVYWIEVWDEQSKINWHRTPVGVWENLLENCGVSSDRMTAWQDALTDWEDADDARALNGAETSDYLALEKNRRRAKNAPITDLGEIFWVMGGERIVNLPVRMDSKGRTVPLIELTTLQGDGKINLNTAPPPLIAAALSISLEDAEQMVRTRAGPDGVEGTDDDVPMDQVSLPGLSTRSSNDRAATSGAGPVEGAVTTSSSWFRVRGVGQFQGQRVVREALARRTGDAGLELLEEAHPVEARSATAQSP